MINVQLIEKLSHTGQAKRQHRRTDCIRGHPTDRLHYNNKMILAHLIINRTILIF